MTVTELVQLYAPLAGLLAVVFWLGVLSQKVKALETTVTELQEHDGPGGNSERLVRLEVTMEGVQTTLQSLDRGMQGVQRQLGNLMLKGGAGFEHRGEP